MTVSPEVHDTEPLDLALAAFTVLRRRLDSAKSPRGRASVWDEFTEHCGDLLERGSASAPWNLVAAYEREPEDPSVRRRAADSLLSLSQSRLYHSLEADGREQFREVADLRAATACRLLAELAIVTLRPEFAPLVFTEQRAELASLRYARADVAAATERVVIEVRRIDALEQSLGLTADHRTASHTHEGAGRSLSLDD